MVHVNGYVARLGFLFNCNCQHTEINKQADCLAGHLPSFLECVLHLNQTGVYTWGSGELNNGLSSVYCLFIHHNDFIVCILLGCYHSGVLFLFTNLLMCRNLYCRQKTKDTENWYVSEVQYKAGASITRPQRSLWVTFHNWLFIKKKTLLKLFPLV